MGGDNIARPRKKSSVFETRTESKLYVLLGSNCPEPMGKGRLGIKTGDFALRRMEDNVQRFAVGLTLHAGQGQIEIKNAPASDGAAHAQASPSRCCGRGGSFIDIEAAVIVRDADALDGAGQGDKADIVFEHRSLFCRP